MPEDENLTFLERRISDLELGFAEMRDKIDEIEDLVMVEQAGIVEIKNMIEEVKATSPEAVSVIPRFENRLKKIENEIALALKGRPGVPSEGVLPVAEIERIYKKINELENIIAHAKPEKGLDYSFLSSIDALKKNVEELSFKTAEADSKLEVIEHKIEDLKNNLKVLTERGAIRGTAINEKEIEELSVRIDNIENLIKSVTAEVQGVERRVEDKIEVLERAPERVISADFEANERRMEELNMKIESIEKNIEGITAELRARKVEEPVLGKELSEKEMKKIFDSISILSKDIEENRSEIFQKTTEISALAKKIEENNRALSSAVYSEIKAFKEKMETLEAGYYNLSKQMKSMRPEDFERAMEKIGAMAVSIEDRYRKELDELKATISRVINELKTPAVMDKEINELLEKIVFLESRLKVVEKNIDEAIGSRPVVLE